MNSLTSLPFKFNDSHTSHFATHRLFDSASFPQVEVEPSPLHGQETNPSLRTSRILPPYPPHSSSIPSSRSLSEIGLLIMKKENSFLTKKQLWRRTRSSSLSSSRSYCSSASASASSSSSSAATTPTSDHNISFLTSLLSSAFHKSSSTSSITSNSSVETTISSVEGGNCFDILPVIYIPSLPSRSSSPAFLT